MGDHDKPSGDRSSGSGRGGRGGDRSFGSGRGGRGGDRDREGGGRGRGRGRGRGAKGAPKTKEDELKNWVPTTKLGRLVKAGLVKKLEQVYLYSLPIKEYQIIDTFFPKEGMLKDEVLKIMPVQKQTRAGQRTRFKAFVVIGDNDGHLGLGVKCAKEVATAIRAAINLAKISIIPVRRGYWGGKIGKPHTVPTKVTGKTGSVRVRLVPAPRGTGIVAAETPAKLLTFAGIEDVFTNARGHTKTLGNFAKATFQALTHTYQFLTPDLWKVGRFGKDPFHEHTQYLAQAKDKVDEKVDRLDDDRPPRGDREHRGGFGGGDRGGDRYGGGDRGGDRYGGGGDRYGGGERRTERS